MTSDLHAVGAQLGNDYVDALLFDRAQRIRGDAQADPALLALEPETLRMQVRQEAATLLVVGVRGAITSGRPLAGNFADAGHTELPSSGSDLREPQGCTRKSAALYQPRS